MLELIQSLKSPLPKFDTVLHLGAGPYFRGDLYESIPANHYVLVEADPEHAIELRDSAGGSGVFQIIECLLAPQSGQHSFRRFTFPSLNGLFGLGASQQIYPRARETGQIAMEAGTFADLLAGLKLDASATNALIFDIPGLEATLLQDAASRVLEHFDWVFVSGAGKLLMDGANPVEDTLKIFRGEHYAVVAQEHDAEAFAPEAILQRDRRALELQALRKERDELKTKLAAAATEHSDLSARNSQLATAFKELEGKHSSLSTLHSSLVAERDQARSERDSAAKEREALKARAGELEAARVKVVAERDSAAKERDELVKERDALKSKIHQLDTSYKELTAKITLLENSSKVLATERDAARKERELLKNTANEKAIRIAELELQVADQAERQKGIDEELAKAEGQLQMLKDLLRPALP